jgi:hypothetical protein
MSEPHLSAEHHDAETAISDPAFAPWRGMWWLLGVGLSVGCGSLTVMACRVDVACPMYESEQQVSPMQELLEELVRGLGWIGLKAVTLGRYESDGATAQTFERMVGLLILGSLAWAAYQ